MSQSKKLGDRGASRLDFVEWNRHFRHVLEDAVKQDLGRQHRQRRQHRQEGQRSAGDTMNISNKSLSYSSNASMTKRDLTPRFV